jgi:Putative peptidoglycan binding domain
MTIFKQRWTIAALVAFAFVLTFAAMAPAHTRQTASSTSSTPQAKKTIHRKYTRRRHHSSRMHLPAAPSPDRISEIQSALAHGGYYKGEPNGKWDSDTVAAMQKFQSANGLDSTGKLDAPTLQKLGLGSDIAGVSAPKPVVPKCCSTSPSATIPPTDKGSTPPPSSVVASTAARGAAPSTTAGAAASASESDVDPKTPQH